MGPHHTTNCSALWDLENEGCLEPVYVYYTVYLWLNIECRLMQLDSEIEMLCIFD